MLFQYPHSIADTMHSAALCWLSFCLCYSFSSSTKILLAQDLTKMAEGTNILNPGLNLLQPIKTAGLWEYSVSRLGWEKSFGRTGFLFCWEIGLEVSRTIRVRL